MFKPKPKTELDQRIERQFDPEATPSLFERAPDKPKRKNKRTAGLKRRATAVTCPCCGHKFLTLADPA